MTGVKRIPYGGCLPTERQRLFLRACLNEGETAKAAWQQWQSLYALTDIEPALFRLLPLLYRRLRDADYNGAEMVILKGVYRRNWYIQQSMRAELQTVFSLFAQAGTPSLLFKGMALSRICYPDPYARAMGDIDILIPFKHAQKTVTLLEQHGWKPGLPLKNNFLYTMHGASFRKEGGRELDLHWHLFNSCCGPHDDDKIWQHAIPFENALTLCPEDHILHTCIHGFQWSDTHPLRWIADMHFLLQRFPAPNWERIAEEAQKRGFALRLLAALDFLAGDMGFAIPAEVGDRLRALPSSRFHRKELALLTHCPTPDFLPTRIAARMLWEAKRAWYLQRRLYPDYRLWQRLIAYPSMLLNEMRLHSVRQLPGFILHYVKRLFRDGKAHD